MLCKFNNSTDSKRNVINYQKEKLNAHIKKNKQQESEALERCFEIEKQPQNCSHLFIHCPQTLTFNNVRKQGQ